MAIHFLDTPLQKALAFLPDFGGSALLHLCQDLKNGTIAKTQEIYLRTLVDTYSKIGVLGSAFFTGLFITVLPHLDARIKPGGGFFLVYTVFAFLNRIQIERRNAVILSQLHVQLPS